MGATKTFIKHILPTSMMEGISPKWHAFEAAALHAMHRYPAKGLNIVGVTGAGSKTTAHLIHNIMYEAGYRVGLLSSAAWGAGMDLHPADHTNYSVKNYIQRINCLKSKGVEWVVLDMENHDIKPHLFYGARFHLAVMASGGAPSSESSLEEALALFEQTQLNKNGLRIGVYDAGDSSADHLKNSIERNVSYSLDQGDLTAQQVRLQPSGSQFAVSVAEKLLQKNEGKKKSLTDEYLINCKLPGKRHVSNALAAIGACRVLGIRRTQIEQGIASVKSVPGERAAVDEGQLFDVIIDDAHTPDAFEGLFSEIKPRVTGKLLVMFGSVGGREHSKRAILGKIAGEYADIVVITEGNNHQESPSKIRNEIAAGAVAVGKRKEKDLFLIKNREEAIKFTLTKAKPGDTVLLLGKGHKKTIMHKNNIDQWTEITLTKRLLKKT